MKRASYDTSIKHITRHGLLKDFLTTEQISLIPSSNISRWKHEAENKYKHSEINEILKQELELIKRINKSSKIKKINQSYFQLVDAFHQVITNIKGVKTIIKDQKELVVTAIEKIKDIVPIDIALKVFNISRTTFHHYKSIVIHKCENSYFQWCNRRFSNQLLSKEVLTIKKYMVDDRYRYWSKASIYLKAMREGDVHCSIATFYKYCRLLGYSNRRFKRKSDSYNPVKTNRPNELWCADVTIFKTRDGVKHYIHFLMDHYSKMILGYRIEKSSSAKAIKDLLENSYRKYQPKNIQLLTDGGSENVNTTVTNFLNSLVFPIKHIIAQKDVVFSNSMVEALNKVIKHQFLYHRNPEGRVSLEKVLLEVIQIYNTERPQWSLGGNTPFETHNGVEINLNRYKIGFKEQKQLRISQNKENACKICH